MRDRGCGGAVLVQQQPGLCQQVAEVLLDALTEAALEQVLVASPALALLPRPAAAATDLEPLGDAVRRDGPAHAPEALHERGQRGRGLQVAGDAGRAVALEEHLLPGQRREAGEDVGFVLRAPP